MCFSLICLAELVIDQRDRAVRVGEARILLQCPVKSLQRKLQPALAKISDTETEIRDGGVSFRYRLTDPLPAVEADVGTVKELVGSQFGCSHSDSSTGHDGDHHVDRVSECRHGPLAAPWLGAFAPGGVKGRL